MSKAQNLLNEIIAGRLDDEFDVCYHIHPEEVAKVVEEVIREEIQIIPSEECIAARERLGLP